jgi:hypothetical protein
MVRVAMPPQTVRSLGIVGYTLPRHVFGWHSPREIEMAITTHQVNLDALIRREDFEAREGEPPQRGRLSDQLKVEDLERTYFNLLRKPDFQRDTASWGPETVVVVQFEFWVVATAGVTIQTEPLPKLWSISSAVSSTAT